VGLVDHLRPTYGNLLITPTTAAGQAAVENRRPALDHRYIDEHSLAQRYLDNALDPSERAAFEQHFVDCIECLDRLALAGMFHARNGKPVSQPAPAPPQPAPAIPLRARFVAQFKPWQLVIMFLLTAVLLLAIPTAYFLWQLGLLFRH
jgi:hypothetical protein